MLVSVPGSSPRLTITTGGKGLVGAAVRYLLDFRRSGYAIQPSGFSSATVKLPCSAYLAPRLR